MDDQLDYLSLGNNRGLMQLFESFAPTQQHSENDIPQENTLLYSRRGVKCKAPSVITPRRRRSRLLDAFRKDSEGVNSSPPHSPPSVERSLSLKGLQVVHQPPTPGCIVVSNMALYFFPPPFCVDNVEFVPLISYERYTWAEIEFVSLPYTEKVNEYGEDYSVRMDDLVLHFTDGGILWLRTETGGRSELVQVIADAFDRDLDIKHPQRDSLALQLDSIAQPYEYD